MKIAILGGGGVRSIFLARSLGLKSKELNITHISFMDNNPQKLNIYGKMAEIVALKINPDLHIELTLNPSDAMKNADYIITTIRPGGDEMRCRDERIALNAGVLGQETTGAAGFSFAMRTIPSLIEYCEIAKKVANKGFLMFNFTNPAGLVSQALRDLGYDFTYGICDAPSSMLARIAEFLNVPESAVTGECYGLNHLSFFSSIKLFGKDIMADLINDDRIYTKTDMRYFKKDLVRHVNCILNEYLYYYYYRQEAVDNILNAPFTRGELILDVNKSMTEELSSIDIENDFDTALKVYEKWHGKRVLSYMQNETGSQDPRSEFHFNIYREEESGYAGVVLKYIESKVKNEAMEMILNLPNGNSIDGLNENDVAELTCTIKNGVILPHKIEKPDEMNMELIRRVKKYENLAVKAILSKDRAAAVDALTCHPLVNSYSIAAKLADEYISLNKEFSSQWK